MYEEKIQVIFAGNLSNDCEQILSDEASLCGFAVIDTDKSCYLSIGSIEDTKERLDRHDGSLLILFLETIIRSTDESADELYERIKEAESGIVFNGESCSNTKLLDALGILGFDA